MEEELCGSSTTEHTDHQVEHDDDDLPVSVKQTDKHVEESEDPVSEEIEDPVSEEIKDPVLGLTREVTGDEQSSELDSTRITEDVHSSADHTDYVEIDTRDDELEKDKHEEKEEDDDGSSLDLGDLLHADEESRNQLFARGLAYERRGKQDCALKCYVGSISGLQQDSKFVLLPQCLRNIADIYYKKEQYDKAICFIQAEKLFYENALIDTTEIQQRIEEIHRMSTDRENNEGSGDSNLDKDILRAEEYEHLAKLCVDKKQPQLALEYAGKATKIRQQIYGDDHQITKHSLDYFATLYAEVGRHQYNESLQHLSESPDNMSIDQEGVELNSPDDTFPRSPSSILRQRKTGEDKEKKQVRFEEPQELSGSDRHQEEWISHALLCMLFAICFVLLFILGSWLYCNIYTTTFCQSFREEFHYCVRKLNYFYYQYGSTKKIKYS